MVIEKIKEFPVDANEHTYDYLWFCFKRVIAESQHEKNFSSIQEGFKKGPKKIGVSSSSQDPKPKSKGKGEGKERKRKGFPRENLGQG